MHTAMLWFDNSKSSADIKINKAAKYYEKKYGRKPNLVFINPIMLDGGRDGSTFSSEGLTIRAYRPVLPGHIWIGMEDKEMKS